MSELALEDGMGARPRVVVTRGVEQAAVLGEKLLAAGMAPVYLPTIRLQALPAPELNRALADMGRFDWLLFSSVNGVRFFFRRLAELEISPRLPRTAVVGPATAREVAAHDVPVDFMPQHFTGEALAAGLGDLSGQHILLPRARIGGAAMVERLQSQGAQVQDIALYDTVTAAPDEAARRELDRGYEAISFASPSSVRGFLEICGGQGDTAAVVACIGPVTAEAASELGFKVTLVPDAYTLDGLVQVLSEYFGEKNA
jgi:uroporphyrinogen III methyltransferase/synthase